MNKKQKNTHTYYIDLYITKKIVWRLKNNYDFFWTRSVTQEGMWVKMSKKEEIELENDDKIHEVGEDATKYGEFISSYFAWISLPQQKERAEKLQEITKKNEKRKNKDQ